MKGLLGIEVRYGLRIEQNKSSRTERPWSIVNVAVLLGPSFIGNSTQVIGWEEVSLVNPKSQLVAFGPLSFTSLKRACRMRNSLYRSQDVVAPTRITVVVSFSIPREVEFVRRERGVVVVVSVALLNPSGIYCSV